MNVSYTAAPDSDLLDRFRKEQDQLAFAELVRRHGPMVVATGRRLTGVDAEDVLQSTFLALSMNAGRIRDAGALAGWLHVTARRCALTLRSVRNREPEQQIVDVATHAAADRSADPAVVIARQEVDSIVDDEVARLPADLRAAVVLCEFEGLSRAQAALRCGVPSTTLQTRLAKAHKVLAARLRRRGVALTAGGVGAWVAACAANCSAVAPALATATARTAAAYSSGLTAAQVSVSEAVLHAAIRAGSGATATRIGTICLVIALLLAPFGVWGGGQAMARSAALEDDFLDGSIEDDSPVSWVSGSAAEVRDGSLVLTSSDVGAAGPGDMNGAGPRRAGRPLVWQDGRLRTRLRFARESPSVAGFNVRYDDAQAGLEQGYYAVVANEGRITLGAYAADPDMHFTVGATTVTEFTPWQEDLEIQLDAHGPALTFSAWPADAPSRRRQISWVDPANTFSSGRVGLAFVTSPLGQSVAFRYFSATPAPSPASPDATGKTNRLILQSRPADARRLLLLAATPHAFDSTVTRSPTVFHTN